MSDLSDLYQEVILDHSKNPRNKRAMENATRKAEGYNPLCGDRFTVYLRVEDGIVRDISFEGSGCAISTASASLMTEDLKGKPVEMAHDVFDRFHKLLTGDNSVNETAPEVGMGKLAVFGGVRRFPVRVKCATLPWHTMETAMQGEEERVSTE